MFQYQGCSESLDEGFLGGEDIWVWRQSVFDREVELVNERQILE